MSAPLSAKQSDYFWLCFSVTRTWPCGLLLVFYVHRFSALNNQEDIQKSSYASGNSCLSELKFSTKDVTIGLISDKEGKGAPDRQKCREADKAGVIFQPCSFCPDQQQNVTIAFPLHTSLSGFTTDNSLFRKGTAEERDR